jgi:apolipoprotein N-acyltransferase
VLLNVSTYGWYPCSKLPLQHFHHGRLRAIENGLPLRRACHTGVTAAIVGFSIFFLLGFLRKPE